MKYLKRKSILNSHKDLLILERRKWFVNGKKTLYKLKKAPRAWYERLHYYLIKIAFSRTNEISNLYLKNEAQDMVLIIERFVDDKIFGGNHMLSKPFVDQMSTKCEMSLFGEREIPLDYKSIKHQKAFMILNPSM